MNPKQYLLEKDGVQIVAWNTDVANDTHVILDEIGQYYNLPSDLKPGATIVEIGCSVGQISLWLAARDPSCKVYAVEPLPSAYRYLLSGIKTNRLVNVFPFNYAVSETQPRVLLRWWPVNLTGAGMYWSRRQPGLFYDEVDAITTENLFSFFEEDHVDLLILDCEGAEHEIVRSPVFDRVKVDWVVGELHENHTMRRMGYRNWETLELIERRFPRHNFRAIEMAI